MHVLQVHVHVTCTVIIIFLIMEYVLLYCILLYWTFIRTTNGVLMWKNKLSILRACEQKSNTLAICYLYVHVLYNKTILFLDITLLLCSQAIACLLLLVPQYTCTQLTHAHTHTVPTSTLGHLPPPQALSSLISR